MTSRGARFVKNFSFSFAGQIAIAALNLLFVPVIVHGLGLETYGLYILLHAATNFLSLAVLGAGSSSIKFIAEAAGAKDGTALRSTLKLSGLLHGLGPLAVAAALAFGAPTLAVRAFHVRPELADRAAFVLRCAACASVFWALAQWSSSALQGLQRFDAQNVILLLQSGLGTAGAALLVLSGYGLRGAALWYVAANAVAAAVGAVFAWRLVRPAAAALPPGRPLAARSFMTWTLSLWLGSMAWLISFQFDKLILARVASLTALTLYAVPANLLQRLQILPQSVGSVVVPLMSEMGSARHEDLARVYLKAQRFVLWLVLPVLGALFAVMPQFLGLWVGGEFGGSSVWPARLLVLAGACFAALSVPHAVATSRDRPAWLSAVVWAQALLSLSFWYFLIPRYGLLGVALGSLLAQALPAVVYLWAVHGLLRVPSGAFLVDALARPASCAAAMAVFLLAVHQRAGSWGSLIGLVAVGGVIYAGGAWVIAAREDREALRWILRRLR
jgi:O-antigen/teichoic acid export membrane protein